MHQTFSVREIPQAVGVRVWIRVSVSSQVVYFNNFVEAGPIFIIRTALAITTTVPTFSPNGSMLKRLSITCKCSYSDNRANLLAQRVYPEAVDYSPVNVGVFRLSDVRLENPLEYVERDTRRAAVPVHLLRPPFLHHGRVLLCQL